MDRIGGAINDDIKRGNLNILIAGSQAKAYLGEINGWNPDKGGTKDWGVRQAGYLDDYKVFYCPADNNIIASNEILMTYRGPDEQIDCSVVFGTLTEIMADLRYPEQYTKGYLSVVEDRMVIEPKFMKLLRIENISANE